MHLPASVLLCAENYFQSTSPACELGYSVVQSSPTWPQSHECQCKATCWDSCSLFDPWGENQQLQEKKSPLKYGCTVLCSLRVEKCESQSICTAEMIQNSVVRHCQGSGLNVGGGNAGQLCLLLSRDADPLCCRGLHVSSSQVFYDITKWLNNQVIVLAVCEIESTSTYKIDNLNFAFNGLEYIQFFLNAFLFEL